MTKLGILLLTPLITGTALAQSGDESDTESSRGLWTLKLTHSVEREFAPPNPLEQVTVRGQAPLSVRRQRIDEAEVEFWDAFNDANSSSKFDVTCRMEAPLGTRIPHQVCRPQFLDDATSRAAGAMLQLDKSGSVGLQQVEFGQAHHFNRVMQEEVRGVATSDPEVQEKLDAYIERVESYDEARGDRD